MNYHEQLQSDEWKRKRLEILERDNFECQHCHVKRSQLLGLHFEFGIKDYTEMTNLGYVVHRNGKNNGSIEILLRGNNIPFISLVDNITDVKLEDLNFAMKWRERVNDWVFPTADLVCFSRNSLDDKFFFDLNVHHKYYKTGKLAWEYDNDAFITLCIACHKTEHEAKVIPILNEQNEVCGSSSICNRCGGSGVLPQYEYYLNGVCFKCDGLGSVFDANSKNESQKEMSQLSANNRLTMIWKSVNEEMPKYPGCYLVTIKSPQKTFVDVVIFSTRKRWVTNSNEISHWTENIPYEYNSRIVKCYQCGGSPIQKEFLDKSSVGTYCEECKEVIKNFNKLTELSRILPAKE